MDAKKYTKNLLGARILIIGGSSGIGYGVAEALLEHGATVVISSSSEARINSAVSSLQQSYPSFKANVSGYACNLGDLTTMDANLEKLFRRVGSIDHLVFTAGDALAIMPLDAVTVEAISKAGAIRFYAPILATKHAVKYLSAGPKSSITFTTGSIAERPMPGWTVVNGFGTGLHGLTRGLALDLAPIRVNAVGPGAVDTPLWDSLTEDAKKQVVAATKKSTTTGEMGQIEDVAHAYLYVMQDKNVSGSVINTNGGSLLK